MTALFPNRPVAVTLFSLTVTFSCVEVLASVKHGQHPHVCDRHVPPDARRQALGAVPPLAQGDIDPGIAAVGSRAKAEDGYGSCRFTEHVHLIGTIRVDEGFHGPRSAVDVQELTGILVIQIDREGFLASGSGRGVQGDGAIRRERVQIDRGLVAEGQGVTHAAVGQVGQHLGAAGGIVAERHFSARRLHVEEARDLDRIGDRADVAALISYVAPPSVSEVAADPFPTMYVSLPLMVAVPVKWTELDDPLPEIENRGVGVERQAAVAVIEVHNVVGREVHVHGLDLRLGEHPEEGGLVRGGALGHGHGQVARSLGARDYDLLAWLIDGNGQGVGGEVPARRWRRGRGRGCSKRRSACGIAIR